MSEIEKLARVHVKDHFFQTAAHNNTGRISTRFFLLFKCTFAIFSMSMATLNKYCNFSPVA